MLRTILRSPWTGAVGAVLGLAWDAFWLVGPPLGLNEQDRKSYLLWGLIALSVSAFQAFYTLIRENRQLKERLHQRANRPFIAPRKYETHKTGRFGLTVTNSEYDAFDVHIPEAAVGDYVLQFNGVLAQVLHKEEAFFETWLVSRAGLPNRSGSALFQVMTEGNIDTVHFAIISKDTSPTPNWYRDNCAIKRDVQLHRTGLLLSHVNQEMIRAPAGSTVHTECGEDTPLKEQ